MARDPKRLQRLQRVRQAQEELAKATWVQAELAAQRARQAHAELQDSLRSSREQLANPKGSQDPAWIALNQTLETHLGQRINVAGTAADIAQQQADSTRTPWQERRAESEGIGKLLDHAQEVHRKDAQDAQNRELDEVALRRSQAVDRNK